jgi:hypothetical protein
VKTDAQIKLLVTAAIRRHSRDLETWANTGLWEAGEQTRQAELLARCSLAPGELPILYSYGDASNWTFVATRNIWSRDEGQIGSIDVADVVEEHFGNFKGHNDQKTERLILTARDGRVLRCPYETGLPSMGTVYAVRTLRRLGP